MNKKNDLKAVWKNLPNENCFDQIISQNQNYENGNENFEDNFRQKVTQEDVKFKKNDAVSFGFSITKTESQQAKQINEIEVFPDFSQSSFFELENSNVSQTESNDKNLGETYQNLGQAISDETDKNFFEKLKSVEVRWKRQTKYKTLFFITNIFKASNCQYKPVLY